jgi:hypothetical protein
MGGGAACERCATAARAGERRERRGRHVGPR